MARQIGISDELAKVWNAPQAVGKLGYDPTLSEAKLEIRGLQGIFEADRDQVH